MTKADTQLFSAPLPSTAAHAAEQEAARVFLLQPGKRFDWELAYRTIAPALHRWVLRMCGDPDVASDIVHETFTRTMARLAAPTHDVEVRPYLFAAAHNLLRTRLVRDRRAIPVGAPEELPVAAVPAGEDPVRATHQADEVRQATAALAALPDRQRSVVVLCDMEGCSYQQAGEALGLTANAVAQLLLRARTRLRLEFRLRHTDTSRLAASCRANTAAISRLLDGELTGVAAAPMTQHVESCADCAQVRSDFEVARTRVRGIMLAPLPVGYGAFDVDTAWAQVSGSGAGAAAGTSASTSAAVAAPDRAGAARAGIRKLGGSRRVRRAVGVGIAALAILAIGAATIAQDPPARPVAQLRSVEVFVPFPQASSVAATPDGVVTTAPSPTETSASAGPVALTPSGSSSGSSARPASSAPTTSKASSGGGAASKPPAAVAPQTPVAADPVVVDPVVTDPVVTTPPATPVKPPKAPFGPILIGPPPPPVVT